MYNTSKIFTNYDDLVFDVTYNKSGTRMATTSSDKSIQVWDKNKYGHWRISSLWKAGDSLVCKLLWIDEVYGEILVACSSNNVITMWKESAAGVQDYSDIEDVFMKIKYNEHSEDKKFVEEKYLRKCDNEKVNRFFAYPGKEYDVSNLSENLHKHRSNMESFQQYGEPDIKKSKTGYRADHVEHATMLKIVDTNESKFKGGKLVINEKGKLITENCPSFGKWKKKVQITLSANITDVKFAPYDLGLIFAVCCSDGCIKLFECVNEACLEFWHVRHELSSELSWSCMSWTNLTSENHVPLIAVGSIGTVKQLEQVNRSSIPNGCAENALKDVDSAIIGQSESINYALKIRVFEFHKINKMLCPTGIIIDVCDPVRSVAFSPTLSNVSYNTLAVASKDITVFKLEPEWDMLHSTTSYNVVTLTKLDVNECHVWNLEWNTVGDLLVSSSNSGYVHLWKNYDNYWNCVSTISGGDCVQENQTSATKSLALNTPSITQKTNIPSRKLQF